MKRIFTSLLLVGIAFLVLLPTAVNASFEDMPRDHWAYDAVDYLEAEGFVTGYPDGTFRGDNILTRYEFAMVISRLYDQFLDLLEDIDTEPPVEIEAVIDMLMEEFTPEIDELRDLVNANSARIDELEGTVDGFDSRIDEITGRVDDLLARFHPYGRLALRFQGHYPESGLQSQRARMSFRFGFTSHINDELVLGARLSTGPCNDRQASYETYDDTFGFDQIQIAQAYMVYDPANFENFTLWAGKFAPPWTTTPVTYDSNVQVEGLAQHFNYDDFHFYLGELVPAEKGYYLVAEIGYDNLLTENFNAALQYHYINDEAWDFILDDMACGDLYSCMDLSLLDSPDDYRAISAWLSWHGDVGSVPVAWQANYLRNLEDSVTRPPEADFDVDGWQEAWWTKLTFLNSPSEQGDWNIWGEYGRFEPNSCLSWQTDAGRYAGDSEFWIIGWKYRLLDNTDFQVAYQNHDRISYDDSWEAFKIDVITSFQ